MKQYVVTLQNILGEFKTEVLSAIGPETAKTWAQNKQFGGPMEWRVFNCDELCRFCHDSEHVHNTCDECQAALDREEMGFCNDCGGFWHQPDEIHCDCWTVRGRMQFLDLIFGAKS